MSILYDRIDSLCKMFNVTITTMCKDSGANRASLSDLKMGRKQTLSAATLDRIADYFDTTVDYLLGRTNDPENSDRFGLDLPEDQILSLDEDEQKTPTNGERPVSEEDIKFALFGGEGEITDAMYEEVRQFAEFVKNREAQKKQKKE